MIFETMVGGWVVPTSCWKPKMLNLIIYFPPNNHINTHLYQNGCEIGCNVSLMGHGNSGQSRPGTTRRKHARWLLNNITADLFLVAVPYKGTESLAGSSLPHHEGDISPLEGKIGLLPIGNSTCRRLWPFLIFYFFLLFYCLTKYYFHSIPRIFRA